MRLDIAKVRRWGSGVKSRITSGASDLVENPITPDFAVGARIAALGITFTTGTQVSALFTEGALISLHG
ncbi:hypothetical protein [Bdellovibrio bacteriovorus]|uniref:hypothetical protein n=1 Tax=Bdellovibrio bacteriovorus TaxID=959 RepID=UPI0035A8A8F9